MIRFLLAISFIVVTFSAAQAQSKNLQARAIKLTKNSLVATLDSSLSPAQTFENWLRQIVGKQTQIKWELNDCGSQSGEGEETSKFPLCVEAKARLDNNIYFGVMTAVGSFRKKGAVDSNFKIEGKPVIYYIYVGRASEQREQQISKDVQYLRDLPAALVELQKLL